MTDLFSGASAHITPFSFNSHAIRVIDRDGSPWFFAGDVCAALGYVNSRKAVADHLDDDEKGVTTGDTLGGSQKFTIISESGLYALVLRSRKPEARKFAKWVTSEVLPAIRKTGSYGGEREILNVMLDRLATQLRESNSYPVEMFIPLWLSINSRLAGRFQGHAQKAVTA